MCSDTKSRGNASPLEIRGKGGKRMGGSNEWMAKKVNLQSGIECINVAVGKYLYGELWRGTKWKLELHALCTTYQSYVSVNTRVYINVARLARTLTSLRLNERKFCAIPKFHKENIEAGNTSVCGAKYLENRTKRVAYYNTWKTAFANAGFRLKF